MRKKKKRKENQTQKFYLFVTYLFMNFEDKYDS